MTQEAHDLRKAVWDSLVKHGGNRVLAAEELGKSIRTLNRYIKELNLYADMDKAGLIHHQGPPRGSAMLPTKSDVIIDYIRQNNGDVNYRELCVQIYGKDTPATRARLFVMLNRLKADGKIGKDEERWFVL